MTNVCLLGLKWKGWEPSAMDRKGYKANQWAKEAMVQAMAHSFIEQMTITQTIIEKVA